MGFARLPSCRDHPSTGRPGNSTAETNTSRRGGISGQIRETWAFFGPVSFGCFRGVPKKMVLGCPWYLVSYKPTY